jgi:hypothetical protein
MADGGDGGGDTKSALQTWSPENLTWYADRLQAARLALARIGQTADQQVASGCRSWKGPWKDAVVGYWNRVLAYDSSAYYAPLLQQAQAEHVPSYIVYEVQDSSGIGMFLAMCQALESVEQWLRDLVAGVHRDSAEASKALLTITLEVAATIAAIASAGTLSPLAGALVFIGGSAIAADAGELGSQLIDDQFGPNGTGGAYQPTDFGTAWSHVDWGKVLRAGGVRAAQAAIGLIVFTITLILLPPALGALGALAVAGLTADVAGQEVDALLTTGHLVRPNLGEAAGAIVEAIILPALAGHEITPGGGGGLPDFRASGVAEGVDGPSTRTFTGRVMPGGRLLVDTGDGGLTPLAASLSTVTDAEGRPFAALTVGESGPIRLTSIDFTTSNAAGRFLSTENGWTLQSAAMTVEGRTVWLPVQAGSPLPAGLTADRGGFVVPKGWALGVDLEAGTVRLTRPAGGGNPATTWVFKVAGDGGLSLSAGFRTADGTPLAIVVRPAGASGPELVTLDVGKAGLSTPEMALTVAGRDGVRFFGFASSDGVVKGFDPRGQYLGQGAEVRTDALGLLRPGELGRGVAGPLELDLDGRVTRLDGEWLQVTGGGRAATYLMTDQGFVPVRAVALRDGGIVLPTPEGQVALPRGAVVEFPGGNRGLVTESGGATPFEVRDDGTFVRTGETTRALPPRPVEDGQAANVVDSDLAHVLENGFTARPAPGGIGVFDEKGGLRFTVTPDGRIIVHGDPAEPAASAPVDAPEPGPPPLRTVAAGGLRIQRVSSDGGDGPPLSYTEAANRFSVLHDGQLEVTSDSRVGRFVDPTRARVVWEVTLPFKRGVELTVPRVDGGDLTAQDVFSREGSVRLRVTVPAVVNPDWRAAISRVVVNPVERSGSSASVTALKGEAPVGSTPLVVGGESGLTWTDPATAVEVQGEIVDVVYLGRNGAAQYEHGFVTSGDAVVRGEPGSRSAQAAATISLPGVASGGLVFEAEYGEGSIHLKVSAEAGSALGSGGMLGMPSMKRTIELADWDLPDVPAVRGFLRFLGVPLESAPTDLPPSDDDLRAFQRDLAGASARAVGLLDTGDVDPGAAADVAAAVERGVEDLMAYLVAHPGDSALAERVIGDARAAQYLADELRAGPAMGVERAATLVDLARDVAIPGVAAQWGDVAGGRGLTAGEVRFAERVQIELERARPSVLGRARDELDRLLHDLDRQVRAAHDLARVEEAMRAGDPERAARALVGAHGQLTDMLNTAAQVLEQAEGHPETLAAALERSGPTLDAFGSAVRVAEQIREQLPDPTPLAMALARWDELAGRADTAADRIGIQQVVRDVGSTPGPGMRAEPAMYRSPRSLVPAEGRPDPPGVVEAFTALQHALTELTVAIGRGDTAWAGTLRDVVPSLLEQADRAVRAEPGDPIVQTTVDWYRSRFEELGQRRQPLPDPAPGRPGPPLRTAPGSAVTLPEPPARGPRLLPIAHGQPPGGGWTTTMVPGLYQGIDPAWAPPGWRFTDTVSQRGSGETVVNTTVAAPDLTMGWVLRGRMASTGEFIMHDAFLDGIAPSLRWIPTSPEMVPGRGTPLEAYLTMRQMRILEQQDGNPAMFTGPRVVTMLNIVNVRTMLELAEAQKAGTPLDVAVRSTHSFRYASNSIIQSGGRIVSVHVENGYRELVGNIGASYPQLARYGPNLGPNDPVLYSFDIRIEVA